MWTKAQGYLSAGIWNQRKKRTTTKPKEKRKKPQNNQQTQRWPGTARHLEQSPGKSPLSGDLAGWKVWSCEQGDNL